MLSNIIIIIMTRSPDTRYVVVYPISNSEVGFFVIIIIILTETPNVRMTRFLVLVFYTIHTRLIDGGIDSRSRGCLHCDAAVCSWSFPQEPISRVMTTYYYILSETTFSVFKRTW